MSIIDRIRESVTWWTSDLTRADRRGGIVRRAHVSIGSVTLSGEFNFPSKSLNLRFSVEADPEDTISVAVCVPPVALHASLDCWAIGRRLAKWAQLTCNRCGSRKTARGPVTNDDGEKLLCVDCGRVRYANSSTWEREISVSVHDWAIWWRLWSKSDGWTSETPVWRDGNLRLAPFPGSRVGKEVYTEERRVGVALPSIDGLGSWTQHWAIARRGHETRRGETIPFLASVRHFVDFDFSPNKSIGGQKLGPPIDDGHRKGPTWQLSVDARTIEEAICVLVARVVDDRVRNGVKVSPLEVTVDSQTGSPEVAASATVSQ